MTNLVASADGRHVICSGQDGLVFVLEVKDKTSDDFIDRLIEPKEGVIMIQNPRDIVDMGLNDILLVSKSDIKQYMDD